MDTDVAMFAILATCGKYVNIIERKTKCTILVDASYVVENAELSSSGEASFIVVNTVDHRLWRVNLIESYKLYSECSEKLPKEELMDSEDIFGELLGPSKETLSSQADQFPPSIDPNVTNISVKADDLLYTSDNPILDFALWDSWIAMLLEDSGQACLCICRIEDKADSYKQLKVLQRISLHQSADKSLFTSVFGREATLLNSPVVLVCTNSGCVQSYVVKQVTAKSSGPGPRVICHLNSPIVSICQVYVKWPDKTGEPNLDAISALTSALQAKSDDIGSSSILGVSLLFVSVTGECCLIVSPTEDFHHRRFYYFLCLHPSTHASHTEIFWFTV